MKKVFIMMALMAMAGIAGAQNVRYVYIPGDGEHRIGLVLGPSFGQKEMVVGEDGSSKTESISSSLGFTAGLRWGYETEWGRTVGFGNFVALLYNLTPFSGEYHDAANAAHKISYMGQAASIYESPNLTIDLNDQLKLSLGVGLEFRFGIPGKAKVDGVAMERAKSEDNSDLLASIFNVAIGLDGNVGCKYFITDEFYVGGRLQYNFFSYTFMDMDNSFDDDEPMPKNFAGVVAVDRAKNQSVSLYTPKPMPVQLLFEVGYRW